MALLAAGPSLDVLPNLSPEAVMEHDHEKCCKYLFCAHPKCCGHHGPTSNMLEVVPLSRSQETPPTPPQEAS